MEPYMIVLIFAFHLVYLEASVHFLNEDTKINPPNPRMPKLHFLNQKLPQIQLKASTGSDSVEITDEINEGLFFRDQRIPHNENVLSHLCTVSKIPVTLQFQTSADDTGLIFTTTEERCHETNHNIIWRGDDRQIQCIQHYTPFYKFADEEVSERVRIKTGCSVRLLPHLFV